MSEVKAPDPIDWGTYEDGGTGKPLPPKGEHTIEIVSVTTRGPDGQFLRTLKGYLNPQVDFRVKAPGQSHDGFLSRFNRFNTQKWPNKNASGAADYLRGFGFTGPFTTDEEYATAFEATKGRQTQAGLDWEIYADSGAVNIKGMESFPTGADGKKQSKITSGGQTHYANVRVKYLISQVKK